MVGADPVYRQRDISSVKYDAAIIGAGANGLAAAAHLARAGRQVIVIERGSRAGGRLTTWQFRPGYFASPFMDAVPEIPPQLMRQMDAAVRSMNPAPDSVGLALARARIFDEAALPRRWPLLAFRRFETAASRTPDVTSIPVPMIEAACGGLGALASAFEMAARAAGAELRFGLPAADLLLEKSLFGRDRAGGVLLADGSRIEAAAVISTLDPQQSMFSWRFMPEVLMEQVRPLRFAGSAARLLLALDRPVGDAVLTLAGDEDGRMRWQQGLLPAHPPLTFDPVSARDPGLAPDGAAVATVTLDCIPCLLSEGAWTHQRRVALAARALARLAPYRPNLLATLKAVEIIVPPDIEAALGLTQGDLGGGFGFAAEPGPRTALPRFYLGGPSTRASRLGTGAAGLAAAMAVLAD